jgi:predicted aldo/keto reductase-like oxidoreductase
VLTKTWARDAATARADIERFRSELGTDYIDICLMHCLTEGDWTERYRGVMDVFEEARQKGTIRAHGCSCHSIEALRTAANSPWVQVHLVRINPIGSFMDSDPQTVGRRNAGDEGGWQRDCGNEDFGTGIDARPAG